jgi:hypothetical protein
VLRIAIVGAVVMLAASIVYERLQVSCWQTSISAYYYTPVRAIFVGGLMAIGLALIVIQGSTVAEDTLLNFAGMLAPVVAVVPTTDVGRCWSVRPTPLPVDRQGDLAPWALDNVHNNVTALLVAGALGLLVALILSMVMASGPVATLRAARPGTQYGLLGVAALLTVGTLLFTLWSGFAEYAHGFAAMAMFGCLAAAAAVNAWQVRASAPGFARTYGVIAALMVLTGLVLLASFEHRVLVVEIAEITLFAAAWVAQTVEHWDGTS